MHRKIIDRSTHCIYFIYLASIFELIKISLPFIPHLLLLKNLWYYFPVDGTLLNGIWKNSTHWFLHVVSYDAKMLPFPQSNRKFMWESEELRKSCKYFKNSIEETHMFPIFYVYIKFIFLRVHKRKHRIQWKLYSVNIFRKIIVNC